MLVFNLLAREFSFARSGKAGGWRRYLGLGLNTVWLVAFIALECWLYSALFDKMANYTDFNRPFFIAVLFGFFILGILFSVPQVSKICFRRTKERIILLSRPIPRADIVAAKLLFAYFKTGIFTLATYFPLSIVYGVKTDAPTVFFLVSVFGILLINFLQLCVACLLSVPYNEAYRRFRRHAVPVFVLTLALAFGLSYVYSLFLDLFVNLIQNASLDALFTAERIQAVRDFAGGAYPLYPLVMMACGVRISLHLVIVIALVCGFGLVCIPPFYFYFYRFLLHPETKGRRFLLNRNPAIRTLTPTQALVKKELTLALSDSDGMFSYVTLIAVQPFLIYLVVSAINIIFSTGNMVYIKSLFPAIYAAADGLLILLFLSVINTTSSLSLSKEEKTLSLMKTFPVPPHKQLFIKVMVPFVLSSVSFAVTAIVLCSLGEISWPVFPFLLIAGLLCLAALDLSTLSAQLKRKESGNLVSVLVGFVGPVVIVAFASLSALLPDSQAANLDYVFYSIVIFLELLLLLPFAVRFKARTEKAFLSYQGGHRQ